MSLNWNGKKPVVDCSKDKGFTVQADRNESDINKIVARYQRTGSVITNSKQPFYGDVSEFEGLGESIVKVREAQSLFMDFPADVREKFDNDPVRFVDFVGDEKNYDEAVALGIISKPPEVAPEPLTPGTSPANTPGK